MRHYIRKIFDHDISHEVSIRRPYFLTFFRGNPNFKAKGKTSNEEGAAVVNHTDGNDPRFGDEFKRIFVAEGAAEGDLLHITEIAPTKGEAIPKYYEIEIIKPGDARFAVFDSFVSKNDRHSEFEFDDCVEQVVVGETKECTTVQDFADVLSEMYSSAETNKNAAILSFGLLYAPQIKACGFNASQIATASVLQDSYKAEVNKGMNLYETIYENLYGISFYKNGANGTERIAKIDWSAYKPTEPKLPHNQIVFGAPGTGKSFKLNQYVDGNEENIFGSNYERVTFHPDYTYANFVGAYKPVSVDDEIKYEYVPGPFMTTFVKAVKSLLSDTPERFLLIIEEINRANMAAVFGDIFQLLDRNAEHVSEYSITTTQDMRKYLMKELNCTEDAVKEIKIPSNMYIWATMNSADQGVFPMDTAFKRRWNFEYLDIDEGEDGMKQYAFDITVGKEIHTINWNKLRHKINDKLTDMGVNEDKLLGPYFIAKSVMEGDNDGFIDAFKNKVLMYLYEDAAKHKRDRIFATDVSGNQNKRYSQILKNFDNYGLNIFAGNSFDDAVVENKPIDSADGTEA